MACYVDLVGGDPRAVLDAIAGTAAGQPKPVVASVVTADGHLPADGPAGMPNFLFPESCAAVLARGAERRAWLSRPVGQRPSHDDIDPAAAAALLAAKLQADGPSWLGTADGAAAAGDPRHRDRRIPRCADVGRAGRREREHRGAGRVEGRLARPRARRSTPSSSASPVRKRCGRAGASSSGACGQRDGRGPARSSSRSWARERTCSWALCGIPTSARSWRSAWAAARPAWRAPSRSACCP